MSIMYGYIKIALEKMNFKLLRNKKRENELRESNN